jgi:hypothetical protein
MAAVVGDSVWAGAATSAVVVMGAGVVMCPGVAKGVAIGAGVAKGTGLVTPLGVALTTAGTESVGPAEALSTWPPAEADALVAEHRTPAATRAAPAAHRR